MENIDPDLYMSRSCKFDHNAMEKKMKKEITALIFPHLVIHSPLQIIK